MQNKQMKVKPSGFTPDNLPSILFPYQRDIVTMALQAGKFAAFTATGTGKTIMELSWAKAVHDKTGGAVLILAPLAVAKQTAYIEAEKFGFSVNYCESDADVKDGINITNYEKLHKLDISRFVGVVLDESSILKSFSSKTRNQLIESFGQTPYRFACTATPAPNDYMELGNHAEFLGIMSRTEMLATFFTHDGGNTSQWRLKKHGLKPFWSWVSEWSIVMQKPSDLGYSDEGFELPPLNQYEVKLETGIRLDGELFVTESRSLTEQRQAKRLTLEQRVAEAVNIIGDSDEQWLVWCHLNDESEALAKAITGAVEVKGSDSEKHKEFSAFQFAKGEIKVLVSKPDIFGYGLNFQSCHNMIFVGLNHSFEMLHQSIRRCWRYGQQNPVNVYLICADVEGDVLKNIQRKESQFQEMINQSVQFSKREEQKMTDAQKDNYTTSREVGENFSLFLGDSCEVMQSIESDSVGFSVFSPPFSSLYTYSNSDRDLGNCKDDTEFMKHFKFIVQELHRVLIPGRLVSFHCMDLPVSKQSFGYIGIRDFRGDLIRLFESVGFVLHSQVVIWKDPVTAMQRTKALGLLHKQLEKDSAMSRQGIPDYLVTMRKLGDNPVPVAGKLTKYYGDDEPRFSPDEKRKSIEIWQRYASPVWMDVNMSDTLQYMQARENDDERHICPLQLDVIRRALQLWSIEGDIVLDPFNGIGSTGYCALEMGRKYIGIELKKSYFDAALKNLRVAEELSNREQLSLFN